MRILPISQNAAAAKFHAIAFRRRWNFTSQILDFKTKFQIKFVS